MAMVQRWPHLGCIEIRVAVYLLRGLQLSSGTFAKPTSGNLRDSRRCSRLVFLTRAITRLSLIFPQRLDTGAPADTRPEH